MTAKEVTEHLEQSLLQTSHTLDNTLTNDDKRNLANVLRIFDINSAPRIASVVLAGGILHDEMATKSIKQNEPDIASPVQALPTLVKAVIPTSVLHTVEQQLNEDIQLLDKQSTPSQTQDALGHIHGKLLPDRRELSAFYTLPQSAKLLASLSIPRLKLDWSDPKQVTSLQISDLACGTGTLLAAAYKEILKQHALKGGNTQTIHPAMMSNSLTGADISLTSIHSTITLLAMQEPSMPFSKSNIHLAPFGIANKPQTNLDSNHVVTKNDVHIGSLEYLEASSGVLSLFGKPSISIHQQEQDYGFYMPPESADLIIMNPPYARNSHRGGTPSSNHAPSLAGLGVTSQEQEAMKERLAHKAEKVKTVGTEAGLSPMFLALADQKLKPGGTLAFIMPLAFAFGTAWNEARQIIVEGYQNIMIIDVAGSGNSTQSTFSSDTAMSELALIATKSYNRKPKRKTLKATWVSLESAPPTIEEAEKLATSLLSTKPILHAEPLPCAT